MAYWEIFNSTNRPRVAVVLCVLLSGIALTISLLTQLHNLPNRFVSPFALLLVQPLIFFAILGLFIGILRKWQRAQNLPGEANNTLQVRDAERTNAPEKANEDLKTAQAELQRRWQYLLEAQRLSHSGTFGWKVHSGELIWSDETYRILGITRETNPTLDLVFERVHPEDLDRVRQLSDRAAQNGMDLDLEHRILLPDGVIKYVHAVAHAGRDSSGNLEYMGVVTDITGRKRAEEELQALSRNLQESKAWLEEAQRVAHVGYWIWDLETNHLIWSDETYRIFGLTQQEGPIDLVKLREMIHPDDQEAVFRTAEEAIRSGARADCEHRLFRPNGEMRVVHSLGDLKKDPSGRPYQMFGTTQDVTDRKRAEEELQVLYRDLQESKASLEEAQRVAHIGSWVWDLEKNHVTYSDEYYRIFGLTPTKDPIDIATVREMIHPDDREYVFRTAEESIRSGERSECEHRILRPNGEIRIVHSLGDLKKDASGRPYQMFGVSQDVTDRTRAEQALKRSQFYLSEGERLAHMGSWASNDLGVRWSDDLDIYWSDEIYKIFGLDPKNGPPNLEKFLAAVHPDDRTSMAETIRVMHEQRSGCDITHRIVQPNGEIRYVRCVGVPVVEEGVFKAFHGTTIDVTEHELLTQELRREQAYLAEAQSLTHIGSWATNFATGQNFHISDETVRIHGFDPRQSPIPLERFWDTVHPEDKPAVRATLENAIRTGTDYDIREFRICRADDGQIRFLRTIGHHDPAGETGYYVGITMDVTERKQAEQERERSRQLEADLTQELRREQAYFTDAQRMAHIGSWVYNLLTQKVLHSSDENARLYGFDPSQGPIPAKRFFDTQHVEDAPWVNATLERAVREGTDFYLDEYRVHHTDGSIRFLRAIGHRNASGEPGEYVGVTMDITERKHAEQERERLRQLEAELAHINRVNIMGELAAALAHEIKQPIAASITSANALLRWLARDPPDLERARAAAIRIEQDGNRAADVINRLRSFYKKGTPPERQMVDVKDIIQEMIVLLRDEAVRHSITIHSKLDAETPNILADRVQLQQVFMNLMLNAIEAMKDTGGELTIRSQLNPEGQLLISISDTGVGLPAENAERIFDAFHTTKPQGMGMGLAITRSIVESHGGQIRATANQEAGATFHFTLPVEAEAHA
jgi:PAS domain S-box-containing protein